MKKYLKTGVVAFVLPVFLLLTIYAVWGQYPFGNKTLLIWDMNWQYSAFFASLNDVLHGDASPFYSFARAIGGDMAGVAAYYLMSPFHLVFYFFDESTIYIGILVVTLLKVGAIGVAMNCYLRSHHDGNETFIFSTAYALCSYVIGYFFNIMWLDGLIVLPLLAWGIERLVEQGKYRLYTASLAVGIITNFYVGYMLCVFSVLYFVVYTVFLKQPQKDETVFLKHTKEGIGESGCAEKRMVHGKMWKTILLYVWASLAGGLLSAFITLPTLYSMQGSKKRIELETLRDFVWQFDARWLFSENFAGTIHGRQMILGYPLLYCGVITLILALFYFIGQRGEWRRKAGFGLLLAVVLLSLGYQNLCKLWQALNYTNGSPYRFSFVYCFLLAVVAHEAFYRVSDKIVSEKRLKMCWFALGIVLCAGIVLCRNYFRESSVQETPWLNVIFVMVYVVLFAFVKKERLRNAIVMGVLCSELFLNAEFLYQNGEYYVPVEVSEYQNYMEQTKPFVEQAKLEIGNELYRMVLTGDAYWSVNDGFLFGAAGMDSYTSVERESTHDIAARLGYYTDESFGIHYKSGSTLAAESLLGVKYLIASEMPQTGYETVMEKDNLALYRNKYAFPFAWLADEKILNVADESGDLFAYQNRIFETLYQKEEGQTETGADGETDAESGKNAGEVLQPVKGELAQVEGCEQLADGSYQMAEDAEFGYIVYQLHPEKTGELYFEPSDWGTAKIGVWLNEKEIDFSNQESPVKRLGIVKAGDDVSLRTVLVPGVTFKSDGAGVYMENEMQLAQSADIVENQNVRIERKKDTEIHIFCENPSAEEKYLVCMLPMDEGWKISVDGEKVQAVPVMGNVTAIPLAPGTHEVSMKFVLRGWNMGWCVTVVTFVLVCGPEFVRKMRKVN